MSFVIKAAWKRPSNGGLLNLGAAFVDTSGTFSWHLICYSHYSPVNIMLLTRKYYRMSLEVSPLKKASDSPEVRKVVLEIPGCVTYGGSGVRSAKRILCSTQTDSGSAILETWRLLEDATSLPRRFTT